MLAPESSLNNEFDGAHVCVNKMHESNLKDTSTGFLCTGRE